MPDEVKKLTLEDIRNAVAGSAAAFRLTLKLEAVSPKVFPPTYEGGRYAVEDRRINGEKVPCVVLDSVPSQANRMELALQDAWETLENRDGKQSRLIELPVVTVDFSAVDNPGVPKVTSLQAPHRIADAILRDSLYEPDGEKAVPFRESKIGKDLNQVSLAYATPLLTHAPHCLIFGMWDSTGPRGGLGVKFARAIVSEIIGVHAVPGVTTGSRIDPLNIRANSGILYQAKEGGWTLDESQAVKGKEGKEKGKPVRIGKEGKPSEANHGNVPPTFAFARDSNKNVLRDAEGRPIPKGGFTIEYAEQTTVLSLPALRKLKFPAASGQPSTTEGNLAARTYLAALGLLGATLAVEAGYDLRSRCILRATDPVQWQLLGRPGDKEEPFILPAGSAFQIYRDALSAVTAAGLRVETKEMLLKPMEKLAALVKKSMELAATEPDVED